MTVADEENAGVDEANGKTKAPLWKRLLIILALLVFIFGVFIVPALNQAREKQRRFTCAGNLKCTGLALIIYAGDDPESGFFPSGDTFQLLDDHQYLVNGKIYQCPSAETPSTLASVSNYIYLGGGLCDTVSNAAEVPISADRDGNHLNWFNVAFVDGHVKGYAAPDWDTLMAREGWDVLLEAARKECRDKVAE